MGFRYEASPAVGPVKQGEILGPIWEHRPGIPPTEHPADLEVSITSFLHALVIVMTPDCDLVWDFNERFPDDDSKNALTPQAADADSKAKAVPHVLVCDVYDEAHVKQHVPETKAWKIVIRNDNARYHVFDTAGIGDEGPDDAMPQIFFDFKKPIAVPTAQLYEGLRVGGVRRVARVPAPWRHDVIHRFYGFQSRVSLPT